MACNIFLFHRVNRWSPSLIKETGRLPKYYIADNGLRNGLLMPQSDDDGKLLENAVYLQLRRHLEPMQKISYYSDSYECDFVVQAAADATGCRNCTIVTADENETLDYEGLTVEIVPAWKWLL